MLYLGRFRHPTWRTMWDEVHSVWMMLHQLVGAARWGKGPYQLLAASSMCCAGTMAGACSGA
jgi:hypothetical protein